MDTVMTARPNSKAARGGSIRWNVAIAGKRLLITAMVTIWMRPIRSLGVA
jgi:hypothetical protein